MKTAIAAIVALCLVAPRVSLGCTPAPTVFTGPPTRRAVEATAARLLDQAASVQLVTITRTQVISYRDLYLLSGATWNPDVVGYWGFEPVLRTFAVNQRFKGQAPSEFTLLGATQGYDAPPPGRGSDAKKTTAWDQSERFAFDPTGRRNQPLEILEPGPENLLTAGCQTYLYGLAGQQFLVFLDGDHRLLHESGPVFSYIRAPTDPWLAAVRQVAASRRVAPHK